MSRALLSSVGLILAALLVLSSCSRVTPDNFQKVKEGMTTDQVTAILGKPTAALTQGAFSLNSTTYTYKKGDSEVQVVFLNGKVITKNAEFK